MTSIAEDFETSANGSLALRDLTATIPAATFAATADPHVLSQQLTGAVWECLVRMYDAARARGAKPEPAFALARTVLQRMVVRGFDYLPPADATFAEFAVALYRADRFARPDDSTGFRAVVAQTMVDRGIVGSLAEIVDDAEAATPWPRLPPTWPRPSLAEAYVFLDRTATASRSRPRLATGTSSSATCRSSAARRSTRRSTPS